MPDREKVVAWMNEIIDTLSTSRDDSEQELVWLAKDCLELLKEQRKEYYHLRNMLCDAQNELNNQPQIVRCKDCIHGGIDSASYPHYWCSPHSEYHEADWFCADGVAKDIYVPDKEGR